MPTAIEYALTNHWHTQNGAGGGPPAVNLAQNGAGSGPPNHSDAAVLVPSAPPTGELLFTGPLAALLLVAAIVAAVRRRAPSGAR